MEEEEEAQGLNQHLKATAAAATEVAQGRTETATTPVEVGQAPAWLRAPLLPWWLSSASSASLSSSSCEQRAGRRLLHLLLPPPPRGPTTRTCLLQMARRNSQESRPPVHCLHTALRQAHSKSLPITASTMCPPFPLIPARGLRPIDRSCRAKDRRTPRCRIMPLSCKAQVARTRIGQS